jgi:hypothetical protein
LISVEALLKARPLRVDFTDVDALTPNHFLHGHRNPQLHLDFDSQPLGLKKGRGIIAQEILKHFWNRWKCE